jgi:hypothetical protein
MSIRSNRQTALIVLGSMATFTGIGLGIGGGALVWAHNTHRDSGGYYNTSAEPLDTPSFALTSEKIDLGVNAADYRWIPGGSTGVRLQATANGGRPVFVGIAPTAEVERYLAGSAHAEVTDFELDPFRAELRNTAGSVRPAAPATQTFWAASANGAGTQTVSWPSRPGSWTVVVMNADGSPGVAVDMAVGAKTGALLPIGIGMAGVALVALVGGIAFIVIGSKGRSPVEAAPAPRRNDLVGVGASPLP